MVNTTVWGKFIFWDIDHMDLGVSSLTQLGSKILIGEHQNVPGMLQSSVPYSTVLSV